MKWSFYSRVEGREAQPRPQTLDLPSLLGCIWPVSVIAAMYEGEQHRRQQPDLSLKLVVLSLHKY